MAGQSEEDLVERRSTQGDVVDRDPGLIEVADDLREHLGAAMGRHRQLARVLIERRLPGGVTVQDLGGPGDVVARMDDDLDAGAPEIGLELSAVPLAMIFP